MKERFDAAGARRTGYGKDKDRARQSRESAGRKTSWHKEGASYRDPHRDDHRSAHRASHRDADRDALYSPDAPASSRDLPKGSILAVHSLFPMIGKKTGQDISSLLKNALNAAFPLKKAHRQDLPYNIVQLSRLLTVDRAEMRHPYWASPALTGAYVHYFLPWNIYRLSRLFGGLRLVMPPDASTADDAADASKGAAEAGAEEKRFLLLDLGSGPLTVPVALWLACPELRSKRIVVAAVDCAGHPLQIGRAILESLASQACTRPWEVVHIQAPLEQGIRRAGQLLQKGVVPWLVTAANVLNELQPQKKVRTEDDESEFEESRLSDIIGLVSGLLRRGPKEARALFIEPGTRLGGQTLMGLRALAREEGLNIEGPCPHSSVCPLYRGDDMGQDMEDDLLFLDTEFADEQDEFADSAEEKGAQGRVSKLAGRSWCHFTFTSHGAPGWLKALAEPTGLAKETLSLSLLEVSAGRRDAGPDDAADKPEQQKTTLRIISQPFFVPGRAGRCRYACSGQGLVLLEDAEKFASGTELAVSQTAADIEAAPRDKRSGAAILAVDSKDTAATEFFADEPRGFKEGGHFEKGSRRNGFSERKDPSSPSRAYRSGGRGQKAAKAPYPKKKSH